MGRGEEREDATGSACGRLGGVRRARAESSSMSLDLSCRPTTSSFQTACLLLEPTRRRSSGPSSLAQSSLIHLSSSDTAPDSPSTSPLSPSLQPLPRPRHGIPPPKAPVTDRPPAPDLALASLRRGDVWARYDGSLGGHHHLSAPLLILPDSTRQAVDTSLLLPARPQT